MQSDTKKLGDLVWQAVLWCRVPAGLLALVGLLLASAVNAATSRGIDVEVTYPAVWLLHAAIFPLVMLAVVTAGSASRNRLTFREFLALVPVFWLLPLALGLANALGTFFVYASLSGTGDAIVKDGSFFFNNHGVIREVTETQFHAQRSISLRLYSAFWLYLYLFTAVFLLGARRTTGQ